MSEFTPMREAVETLASRSPAPDFDELERRATRRGRRRVVMVAAAVVAVIAGSALTIRGLDGSQHSAPVIQRPQQGQVVGAVPVWYDAKGLHHGDVVEQTPVDLVTEDTVLWLVNHPGKDTLVPAKGALALVRTGAVYLDPATGDVWFHPWGGDPRIVGHNSEAGPGGDPNGDTAAWFEGSELVVYDTAAGREISRTMEPHAVAADAGGEHAPAGNGFLQVSGERVLWKVEWSKQYSHDVRNETTSLVPASNERWLVDGHDKVEALSDHFRLVLTAPGTGEKRYPDLEGRGRLNPSGSYVLGVEDTKERHGAVIVDANNGEVWRVPDDVDDRHGIRFAATSPWIAWSYGDIAMVDHTPGALLACEAAGRTCEPLPAERPFLMPTN